jgi:hypothetical protein
MDLRQSGVPACGFGGIPLRAGNAPVPWNIGHPGR